MDDEGKGESSQEQFWHDLLLVFATVIVISYKDKLITIFLKLWGGLFKQYALEHYRQNIQTQSEPESLKSILSAQWWILTDNEVVTEASLETSLVIGVAAGPTILGGYCVNLHEKTIEYYGILAEDFPWPLYNPRDNDELQMKNIQFALALWGNYIIKYKRFRLYTGSTAILNQGVVHGAETLRLLRHFTECEGAVKVDGAGYIDRKRELEKFAVYVQPADDFSRWEIQNGINFLTRYYGIDKEKVDGAFLMTGLGIAGRTRSEKYDLFIQRAQVFARDFQCKSIRTKRVI